MTTSENIFRMVVENTSADLKNDLIKLKTSGKECCGATIQHGLFEKTMYYKRTSGSSKWIYVT